MTDSKGTLLIWCKHVCSGVCPLKNNSHHFMVLIFRVGMALALRPQGGCTFVLTLELDGSPAVSPSSRSVGLFQTECRGGRALLGFSLPQMAVSQNLPSQTPVHPAVGARLQSPWSWVTGCPREDQKDL